MADNSMRRIGPTDLFIPAEPVELGLEAVPDELAPSPECSTCAGAGYYKEPVPFGHPNFGKLFPCHCKIQAKAVQAKTELEQLSNLDEFRDKTFENFNPYDPSLLAVFRRAQEYARRPQGWLILFGEYGCGKTHLAAAIGNALVARGVTVFFGTVPEILDHLRSTFGPDSQVEYDDLFLRVRDVPLLILDDLGTEAATPWAREKLFQIVNHRYNLALTTVITSNRPATEIDGRIWSRMSDRVLSSGGPLHLQALDYRGLTPQERVDRHKQALALRLAAQREEQTRRRSRNGTPPAS